MKNFLPTTNLCELEQVQCGSERDISADSVAMKTLGLGVFVRKFPLRRDIFTYLFTCESSQSMEALTPPTVLLSPIVLHAWALQQLERARPPSPQAVVHRKRSYGKIHTPFWQYAGIGGMTCMTVH